MSTLAIDGGQPLRTAPMPPRLQIDDREIDAVVGLLESCRGGGAFDRYGGVHVDTYEQEFAQHMGTQFATAASAGTAAIHTALSALRLEIGSEVISAPITDVGAIAPILWNNCIPVFADTDPDSFLIDPASVRERITDKTRAIICGHITGAPCDMDAIMAIAAEHGLYVIEDCAQAHDAEYKGRKVGSIGHLGAFSLMSGKHSIAGGQGGMVTTNDEELYWNAKRFADRGKAFNSDIGSNLFLGINYRMTELEAVIGRVQLEKLPQIVSRRREAVAWLEEALAAEGVQGVRTGRIVEGGRSAYWFVLLHFDAARYTVAKPQFAAAVSAEGTPLGASYEALITDQYWIQQRQTYGNSQCPWVCPFYGKEISYEGTTVNARKAIDSHMLLMVHECWTQQESLDTARAIKKVEQVYLKS